MTQPTLKLQSYKPDNQALLARIQELDQLKGELESSLGRRRQEDEQVREEVDRLRIENGKLRRQVNQLRKSRQSQSVLIETLEGKVQEAQSEARQYQSQLQAQQHSKREMSQYYEKKVCSILEEKEQLKHNYEREVLKMSSIHSLQPAPQPTPPSSVSNLSQSSVGSSHSPKKIKRLKKNSAGPQTITAAPSPTPAPAASPAPVLSVQPRSSVPLSEKYSANNVIMEKEEDSHLSGEDLYLQMIRKLYKQCQKIELSGKDLQKLPQIQSFARLRSPSRSELAVLLRSYPLHVGEDRKVALIHDYMLMEAERRARPVTGSFIVEEIVKGIQEVEGIYQPHSSNRSVRGSQPTLQRRTSQTSERYSVNSVVSDDDSYF